MATGKRIIRNQNIKDEYLAMRAVRDKKYKKRVHTDEMITAILAEKYFLEERTIINIVFSKVPPEGAEEENTSQVSIFDVPGVSNETNTPT